MQVKFLITDGGPHPAWKHAMVTADKIVQFGDNIPQVKIDAGLRLQRQLETILEKHHLGVEEFEKAKLKKHGSERLSHPLEVETSRIDGVMTDFLAATKGTVLEEHFSKPEVQEVARHILTTEFLSQAHIHRSWHADANPGSKHAKAFRDASNGVTAPPIAKTEPILVETSGDGVARRL